MVGVELAKQMGRWTAHRMSPDAMAETFTVRTVKEVALVGDAFAVSPAQLELAHCVTRQ